MRFCSIAFYTFIKKNPPIPLLISYTLSCIVSGWRIMILHSFRVSTLWYLGKILRPNSRIVSIEISFVFSPHPFSNRRYQHSSALIGNIHSSSKSRNIDHRRCHPFAAVAACFTNFRLHSPCVIICDNHFLFPRIGSYHSGYLNPPQKINNNTHSVGFHFLPNDLCVVMPGF